MKWWCPLAGVLLLALAPARARVTGHALFTDGAVLQQGQMVPVWGGADSGEEVTVQFRDQTVSTVARDGRWQVWLEPLTPGGPDSLLITGAENSLRIDDILVGEVWLCAGQSNMAFRLSLCEGGEAARATSDNPRLRLFSVPRTYHNRPRWSVESRWQRANPATTGDFSGLAWFFGTYLQQSRNVPVGLIDASVGGTPIEPWMSLEALRQANYTDILNLLAHGLNGYDQAADWARRQQADWNRAAAAARAAGQPTPEPPDEPLRRLPTALHNAMIAPLAPFGLRGIIWYQGESNVTQAWRYRTLLSALLRDWRRQWGRDDLPVLLVQLPAYQAPNVSLNAWPALREAQLLCHLIEPDTALVVTCDLPEAERLHPRDKRPIAQRLVLAARATAYGEPIVGSGPIYRTMFLEGWRVRLTFSGAEGGLVARGARPTGFTLAGADGRFQPARAMVDGEDVLVWHDTIDRPVAVRYGWDNIPRGNLYNRAGLPASPFRTDDFPLDG